MNLQTLIILFFLNAATSNASTVATVNINNYGPFAKPIYLFNSTLLPATESYVQLLHNGVPIAPVGSNTSIIPLSEDGQFFGGVGVVYSVDAGNVAEFALVAWTGAATWPEATIFNSVSWFQRTGTWDPDANPPLPPVGRDLENPALTLIPEFSSFRLVSIGSVIVIVFYKRRQLHRLT